MEGMGGDFAQQRYNGGRYEYARRRVDTQWRGVVVRREYSSSCLGILACVTAKKKKWNEGRWLM